MDSHKAIFKDERRAVAVEVARLLQLRRSVNRMRRSVSQRNANDLIRTPMGNRTRAELLGMAERAFREGIRRVCRARRNLFEKCRETV